MTLAVLLLGLIPGLLQNLPGISAAVKQIIADVAASASAVLASGAVSGPSVNTILAAWLGVVNALKTDPNINPNTLAMLAQLEKILQSVLTTDASLAKSVNWQAFHPVQPVP
jgi:hypothetical protein